MKTQAAILVETGKPLELVELEIPALKPGQVLVEIAFSGVCHTQLLEARGYRGADPFLPHCLGHEGSGVVLETGPGVTRVKPGEAVVLSWIKAAGMNVPGVVYTWGDKKVNAGAVTTFSRHAVISENRLTPIPAGISMRHAALLGCAIPTGFGIVFNTANPQPGQSLAVFGVGGIGLCAIAAAAMAGCVPVIAVDVLAEKLDLAMQLGATYAINAAQTDPVAEINRLCGGGVDFAVEASGRPAVMAQALHSVRAQGGVAAIAGNAHHGEHLAINPAQLNQGKQLRGSWGGDSVPDRDFNRYGRLLNASKFNPELLLTTTYSLAGINQALTDLETGVTPRPLIEMGLE